MEGNTLTLKNHIPNLIFQGWQWNGHNWGVEFKYEDAPRRTRSMQTAIEDLQLACLWIVYPGKTAYSLAENIRVIPLAEIGPTWTYG